ncbi:MAG UNVERIFIED_CONTAM: hypothetical protein LVR29_34455 [Microcystis novacekii LVE1205-3]
MLSITNRQENKDLSSTIDAFDWNLTQEESQATLTKGGSDFNLPFLRLKNLSSNKTLSLLSREENPHGTPPKEAVAKVIVDKDPVPTSFEKWGQPGHFDSHFSQMTQNHHLDLEPARQRPRF